MVRKQHERFYHDSEKIIMNKTKNSQKDVLYIFRRQVAGKLIFQMASGSHLEVMQITRVVQSFANEWISNQQRKFIGKNNYRIRKCQID